MRICHLGKFYPPAPGGMETYVRTLAQAQARRGAEVTVLCMNHLDSPTSTEDDGPVKVKRFRRAISFGKLDYCPGLVSTIASSQADIIHLHVPNPTMILATLMASPHASVFVTYQSDVIRQKIRSLLFAPLEFLFYRTATTILATSEQYANCSNRLSFFRKKVKVVPMGIQLGAYLHPSTEDFRKAREIREHRQSPIWLCCSRLVYYKGLGIAIQALLETPGTLVLVGDGPERDRLDEEARRLGVFSRVVFVGQLPSYLDVIPYYLAADALWLPSNERSEAFGLVQVEAMACGLPVINTAISGSGVSWVSPHEQTGLTVPVNDAGAFARAAKRLVFEPGLRERLSKAAKRRAVELFDDNVTTQQILALYQLAAPRAIETKANLMNEESPPVGDSLSVGGPGWPKPENASPMP